MVIGLRGHGPELAPLASRLKGTIRMAIRRTVLVADDKKNAVAAVRGHLQRDGYRVYAACSGLEALNLMQEDRA